jgi:hypothetical protein
MDQVGWNGAATFFTLFGWGSHGGEVNPRGFFGGSAVHQKRTDGSAPAPLAAVKNRVAFHPYPIPSHSYRRRRKVRCGRRRAAVQSRGQQGAGERPSVQAQASGRPFKRPSVQASVQANWSNRPGERPSVQALDSKNWYFSMLLFIVLLDLGNRCLR